MWTEVLGVGIGDILKFEATTLTRVKVKVSEGTRAGDWVNFSLRGNKLVALTDEQDGYALVQPHNCIIDLRYCAKPENISDTLQQGDRFGIQYIGAPVEHERHTVMPSGPVVPPKEAERPVAPPSPPSALKRSLNFFGDSTNARIGGQAVSVAAAENLPVVNNAQGGSLAAYALMSMNGSPVEVTFKVDTIPAKANGVMVDGELVYGEGVTPFSMHSTVVIIGDDIEAVMTGQTANIKVIPRDSQAHSVVPGKKYPVRLKNSGGVDGICVLATAKNDINGANVGNWQTVLERVKMYVEKCINQVQPKESPRYIVLTVWADNKPGWAKENHPYRHQLKDQFNNWLKSKYGNNVFDIEQYILSDQIWTDSGLTPNEADKKAQTDGVMPLSLSQDGGAHLLPAVEAKVAERIIAKAKELRYL